jgi:hypothetical protein
MEKTDSHFKSLFNNQILKDIKFYNTKESYLALEDQQKWVMQGGVEFILENSMITMGWNSEMRLNEMIEGDLDQLLGEMDVFDIELDQHEEFEKLKGKKIEDVYFSWTWYQKMDDEMELTEEKIYIPQEIKIIFEDKSLLQVATILFSLKNGQLFNPIFDPQGNLLVSLNEAVKIAESPENLEQSLF